MTTNRTPALHRRDRPLRSACIRMNRRRADTSALIAQVFRAVKHQPDRLASVDARGCVVANHAHRYFAHHEIRRLAPGGLEETEDGNAMVGHDFSLCPGKRLSGR